MLFKKLRKQMRDSEEVDKETQLSPTINNP